MASTLGEATMNRTADLFEPRKAVRTDDVSTSKAAAASMSEAAQAQYELILGALREAGRPMAGEEISDWINEKLDRVQIMRRMNELERHNFVARTDERHVNRTGRKACRYALKPKS